MGTSATCQLCSQTPHSSHSNAASLLLLPSATPNNLINVGCYKLLSNQSLLAERISDIVYCLLGKGSRWHLTHVQVTNYSSHFVGCYTCFKFQDFELYHRWWPSPFISPRWPPQWMSNNIRLKYIGSVQRAGQSSQVSANIGHIGPRWEGGQHGHTILPWHFIVLN